MYSRLRKDNRRRKAKSSSKNLSSNARHLQRNHHGLSRLFRTRTNNYLRKRLLPRNSLQPPSFRKRNLQAKIRRKLRKEKTRTRKHPKNLPTPSKGHRRIKQPIKPKQSSRCKIPRTDPKRHRKRNRPIFLLRLHPTNSRQKRTGKTLPNRPPRLKRRISPPQQPPSSFRPSLTQ